MWILMKPRKKSRIMDDGLSPAPTPAVGGRSATIRRARRRHSNKSKNGGKVSSSPKMTRISVQR